MQKILVSGAQGFVGKNLIAKLEDLGFDNIVKLSGKTQCDLTNQKYVNHLINFEKPDIVIHTAARVGGILANSQNPGLFIYENLAMSMNLIEACRKYGKLQKFIMLGTVCSYPKYTKTPFDEEDIWNGYPEETNAPYGIAKRTINELLIAYNKQYGFNSTTLIPTNMYGPYDHFNLTSSHVIPAIILKVQDAIISGKSTIEIWGSGKVTREFLYVEDCVRAIISCLYKDTDPYPINIGTGVETSISDLVSMICKKMGFYGNKVFLHKELEGQPRRQLNIKKATMDLDYRPEYDLNRGLDKTIEWFKENYNENICYSI
jgi:GDP-L-fucose synthase